MTTAFPNDARRVGDMIGYAICCFVLGLIAYDALISTVRMV